MANNIHEVAALIAAKKEANSGAIADMRTFGGKLARVGTTFEMAGLFRTDVYEVVNASGGGFVDTSMRSSKRTFGWSRVVVRNTRTGKVREFCQTCLPLTVGNY